MLPKKSVFSFNGRLYKQTDGCGMGNPLSPVIANIFMARMEADVVTPLKPEFYDRYVDDCFSKKKKDQADTVLEKLNSYHPNIAFTVEENPNHFLDTAFIVKDKKFTSGVYKKPGKFPTHWKSQIPTKWKRNAITGALYRAKRISTDFNHSVTEIRKSFLHAGYPLKFINNTIAIFKNKLVEEEPIIPSSLFEERKRIGIRLPFCPMKNCFRPPYLLSFLSSASRRASALL